MAKTEEQVKKVNPKLQLTLPHPFAPQQNQMFFRQPDWNATGKTGQQMRAKNPNGIVFFRHPPFAFNQMMNRKDDVDLGQRIPLRRTQSEPLARQSFGIAFGSRRQRRASVPTPHLRRRSDLSVLNEISESSSDDMSSFEMQQIGIKDNQQQNVQQLKVQHFSMGQFGSGNVEVIKKDNDIDVNVNIFLTNPMPNQQQQFGTMQNVAPPCYGGQKYGGQQFQW